MSLAEHPTLPPSPAPRLSAAAAYSAVVERLEQTRRRILRCTGAALAISIATAALAGFAVLVVVDYWFEVISAFRGVALFALIGACATALYYGWQKFVSPYTLDRAAIDVENEVDEFGQGLRTALDYQEAADRDFAARPATASPGLLSALHYETFTVSQRVPWDEVAPARWLWQAVLGLLLIGGTCLIALSTNHELRIAAGRMLLLPWQYTQLTFDPQQATIKQGESIVVKATISGRPINAARLRFATKSKPTEWTTVDLLPPDSTPTTTDDETITTPQLLSGNVQTKLTKLQEDLTFEVVAGPVQLPAGNIRVLQPLTLEKTKASITPPAYTKLPAKTSDKKDLSAWEGSDIDLQFTLNRAAATGSLKRIDGPKDKPATTIPAVIKDNGLQFDLTNVRESGIYELTAVAADEMELKPERVKIQVKLDRKPSVKWETPQEQWEVTPTTEVTMSIAANDDLGIHKAGIAYQVGNSKLQTLWETDAAGAEQSLAAVAALLLEERGLTHKDSVTYYAFAEDNYFDETRRTTTSLRFIDIRPYQQDFQLVDGGGSCKGQSVTLEELIKRQRDQLTQSFAAKDQPSLSKLATQKLAAAQTKLQDQTLEFARGLAELGGGNILALDEAGLQMGTAASALTDADLDTAVPAQQQALAYLIMARENLRKKLSNSPSSSQCRKFDREQKQKLRLPEQKKQEQQKQLAQNKKQLEDLAKRERQWSQQASQACQNPSSSASKSSSSSASKSSDQQQQQQADQQPSKEDVAKAQEQMLKELAELQKQIAENDLAGKTAQEQAARAKEAMEQGQKALEQNKGEAASKQGESAADRLEQLAAHLAAMNQKDVAQRLNQAQKNAAELAAKQEQLAKDVGGQKEGEKSEGGTQKSEEPKNGGGDKPSAEQLAGKQGDLAQQAKMLAEVLEKLRQDAQGEKGPAADKLDQIAAEQKPGDIAAGMEKTADDLKQGDKKQGQAGAEQARDELAQLAKTLGAAKGELSQPQLQELMKLEEQLAKLREQAERDSQKSGEGKKPGEGQKPGDGQQAGQAGASEKWEQLQDRLHQLAESDKRLEAALRQLGGNGQLNPGDKLRPSENQQNNGNREVPPGHYSWDQLGDYKGLDEIAKALQTKIQEAILAGALQDADEPVPPEYKGLVEKYYRTLSDDLR